MKIVRDEEEEGERLTVYKLHESEQLRFDRKVTHPLLLFFFFRFSSLPSTISDIISPPLLLFLSSPPFIYIYIFDGGVIFKRVFTTCERYIGYTDRVFKILSAAWFL